MNEALNKHHTKRTSSGWRGWSLDWRQSYCSSLHSHTSSRKIFSGQWPAFLFFIFSLPFLQDQQNHRNHHHQDDGCINSQSFQKSAQYHWAWVSQVCRQQVPLNVRINPSYCHLRHKRICLPSSEYYDWKLWKHMSRDPHLKMECKLDYLEKSETIKCCGHRLAVLYRS